MAALDAQRPPVSLHEYLLVAAICIVLPLVLTALAPLIDAEDWRTMTPSQRRRERRLMVFGGIGLELGCLGLIAFLEWLRG
jgi:hypothetical protein